MLKRIFSELKDGVSLSGTALSDERLNSLYVSYRNPNDYQFNWGANNISMSGSWSYLKSDNSKFELIYGSTDGGKFNVNIFKSLNHNYSILENNGGNITLGGTGRNYGVQIRIPYSGLYKVELSCTMVIGSRKQNNGRRVGVDGGVIDTAPMEIHLVRNLDKSLTDIGFNNKFAYENIEQEVSDSEAVFPQPDKVNFIDAKQDKNFICGFSFGKSGDTNYINPLNSGYCNPMAISGGRSWDLNSGGDTTDRARSAVNSPSYRDRDNVDQNKFVVELQNSDTSTTRSGDNNATGKIEQVIWFDKDDSLDLLFATAFRLITPPFNYKVISDYSIEYELKITPFQEEPDWLKMDNYGSSTSPMNWNDPASFVTEQIDIMQALPSEVKINDWIENFCKAFNLDLHETETGFNLDLKDRGTVKNTSVIIDLDKKASLERSYNQPINAPYSYELGFTVDKDEEGYNQTGDDGGGTIIADSEAESVVTQTSTFSYNWFKPIKNVLTGETMDLPVITDKEIWVNDYDYRDMMNNLYMDKAQRFWYKSGTNVLDAVNVDTPITNALVSNEYIGERKQRLDYKNTPDSITRNFFILLTNQKHYTVVECYLTPEEYNNLGIALVRFNGDMYNVAEIDGYDPLGRSNCTLKLIRKI